MRKVYDNTKNVLVIEPVLHRDPKGTVHISAPRRFGKQIAYSQPVRSMFSKAVNSAAHDGIYSAIKQVPKLYDVVRKISHPPLPEGLFYAKLFIYGWQAIDGKRFRLMHKGTCVYGTTCEPPQKGFQLEYRNIVVTSTNYEEFALEIEDADKNLLSGDIEFRLVFSKTQFSTSQQDAYDLKYGVEFKDGIYYSLRGNTKNPKKLIVTFPGFGSSTARVQYAVSYLGALDDDDLSETCLIALQDRYGVSGTFLIYDDAGCPLQSRIENFINFYVEKFNIAQHNILFFGGSKGATCALYHFKPYKEAMFVGGTSAMNLPHRLKANPFFRDNLGTRPELRDIEQPFSLIKCYIEEKRILHWFYSLDDEIANISMIETLVPSYGLSLYRISGTHPQVIIKSMATILSLIREFLYSDLKRDVALSCMEKKAYQQTDEFVMKVLSDHPLDSQVRGRRSFLLPGVTSKQLASARKTVFIDSATVYQGLQFSLMQVVLDSQFPLWPKHYNQINLYIVRATPQGAEYISLNAHKHSSNIFYLPEENGLVAITWENYKMRYSHIICILNNNEIFVQDLKKIKRVRHLPLLQRNVMQSYSDDFALFELYPHTLFAKSKLAKLSGYTIWHNMYKEHFAYAHTCKLGQWDASLRVHVYLSIDDLKAAVDAIDESDGACANTLLLYTHAQATLAPTLIHRFINEFGVKDATVFIHGMLPQGFQAYNDRMDDSEEKGMSWSVPIVMYEDV